MSSSQQDPEMAINWVRIHVDYEPPFAITRNGPFSNAIAHREHEADVFVKYLKTRVPGPLDAALASYGMDSYVTRDPKKALKKLFATGEPQRLWLHRSDNDEDIPWAQIEVERGYQKDTAEAMNKLIAGEDPGIYEFKADKPGKGEEYSLKLYTVVQRTWLKAFWDDKYNREMSRPKHVQVRAISVQMFPGFRIEQYNSLTAMANVESEGNVAEVFLMRDQAIAYAKAVTGDRKWFSGEHTAHEGSHDYHRFNDTSMLDLLSIQLEVILCDVSNLKEYERESKGNPDASGDEKIEGEEAGEEAEKDKDKKEPEPAYTLVSINIHRISKEDRIYWPAVGDNWRRPVEDFTEPLR